MQHISFKLLPLIALIFVACAENNPYKDGAVAYSSNAKPVKVENQVATHTDAPVGADTTEPDPEVPIVIETPKVADVKSAPPEALNFAQMICDDKEYTAKFPVEMGVFCVGGKPAQRLVDAIAKPYTGTGSPNLIFVQAEDINRVSHFIMVSAVEIPKGQKETFAARGVLNRGQTLGSNATLTQTEVAQNPLQGNQIANYTIDLALEVRVGGISVDLISRATREYEMVKDGVMIKSANYLIPDAQFEDNQGKVATLLSFWLTEGGKTKIVGVGRQLSPNRGRHAVALEAAQSLGAKTLIDTVTNLSK